MEYLYGPLIELIFEIIIFLILVFIATYVYKKLAGSKRAPKLRNLLPEDEVHTLKQVFYLILMALAFADILYSLMAIEGLIYFIIFDIALSVFFAVLLDKSSVKGKIILLLLVPYDSLNLLLINFSLVSFIDIIHVIVFVYFIKLYYGKFRQYTESNGLSETILMLFLIVFVSFILTQLVENVNPLDSLVMVSNAFTSNGYAILGNSIPGKLNSLLLVWGGYILSGVGTATLTAAILIKHFNHRFEQLEELIKDNGSSNQTDDDS